MLIIEFGVSFFPSPKNVGPKKPTTPADKAGVVKKKERRCTV